MALAPGEHTFSDEVGNGKKEGVEQTLLKALHDPQYDMVVALGLIASDVAVHQTEIPKPLFAPFIISIKDQKVPREGEGSGVPNLCYISQEVDLDLHISLLKRVVNAEHIVFMVSQSLLEILPFFNSLQVIAINDGAVCLEMLPQETDAVFIATMPLGREKEIECLANGLIERGLPSYSFASDPFIKKGILMSLSSETHLQRIIRRTALNIERSQLGERMDLFPVVMSTLKQPILNMNTARALSLSVPYDLTLDAKLIDDPGKRIGSPLTLVEAVNEGVCQNTQLQANYHEMLAGLENPKLAKALLFPQVGVEGNILTIDRKRHVRRQIDGFLTLQQMIYSNELIGQYCIARNQAGAAIADFNEAWLDAAKDIANAYFSLLRSQTIAEILRDNLDLTHSNLMLAEERVSAGVARSSEVYRWESQFANNRAQLVTAGFRVKSDMTHLLKLLSRPQGEEIYVRNVTEEEVYWLYPPKWFEDRFNTPEKLERFATYIVCEGFRLSPMLQHFSCLVSVKAEALGMAKRAFWTPDLFFNGCVDQKLYNEEKKECFFDTHWRVSLNLSFPLYTSGARRAELQKSRQEFLQAQLDFANAGEVVEESIRTSLYQVMSAYTSIGLTRASFEEAKKSLKLVQISYGKGTTSIVDLLDAQAQALRTNIEHAQALYGFFMDFVHLERDIGRFDFLLPSEERAEIRRKTEDYLCTD